MKYDYFINKFGLKDNYASSSMESRAEAIVTKFPLCSYCQNDSVYYMGYRRLDTAAKMLPARLDIGLCTTCSEIHTLYVGSYRPIKVEMLDVFPVELGPLHPMVDPFSCGVDINFDNKPGEGVMAIHQGHPEKSITLAHRSTGRRIRLTF